MHAFNYCGFTGDLIIPDSYVDNYIDSLGHNYKNGRCTVCGEKDKNHNSFFPSWGNILDKIFPTWWNPGKKCEHDYASVTTDPTCTQKGYTTYTCNKCGDSYKDDYVNALGHDYVDGVCGNCGDKKVEDVILGKPVWVKIWDWIFNWVH